MAIRVEGRPSVRPQVYEMPTINPPNSPTSEGPDASHQSMALCPMENGHRGGPTLSSKEQEIFVINDRLFHDMGGG